ncbi:MAG: LPS export ABC transporter periplasmic protein LptC [Bacteroides sp.]|nr:LPS export ABC transporter periplasmic protein LptC [Roseburia sp.]MCM1346788.1 LPS export ABC transporter periplasmic protein LptC [Bacteroides sp.]MCM1421020.1 LPS export ABC transporter periplasmic protein LptC [Bacteroides sp.]
MLFFLQSCQSDEASNAPQIGIRDSLPVLKTIGVSTLISDSGVIRYKMIAEEWFVYDKKTPTYWSFEKGLFIEKFDEAYHVEAFISCDTAYYFDQKRLWELRGRVFIKNQKGETFKTSLLFWDQAAHRIYSNQYMEIDGEEQDLSGYDFSSNEQMTDYIIHSSQGAFPLDDKDMDSPVEEDLEEHVDTVALGST